MIEALSAAIVLVRTSMVQSSTVDLNAQGKRNVGTSSITNLGIGKRLGAAFDYRNVGKLAILSSLRIIFSISAKGESSQVVFFLGS